MGQRDGEERNGMKIEQTGERGESGWSRKREGVKEREGR